MAVLKITKSDEDKEISFELDYLMSLSTRERFEMMFAKSRRMALMFKNGRRKFTEIIKRK